jgi:hypothetical protein
MGEARSLTREWLTRVLRALGLYPLYWGVRLWRAPSMLSAQCQCSPMHQYSMLSAQCHRS